MRLILMINCFLFISQFSFTQNVKIKFVDSVFNNSVVIGNDFTVKINNCSDTILNAGVANVIHSRSTYLKCKYYLSNEYLFNFVCSPKLDSSLLIRMYNVLSQKENIEHKVCVASFFKEKSMQVIYLRLFSKKGYKRYLRKVAKIQIGLNDISSQPTNRNLNSLYINTTEYIIIDALNSIDLIRAD